MVGGNFWCGTSAPNSGNSGVFQLRSAEHIDEGRGTRVKAGIHMVPPCLLDRQWMTNPAGYTYSRLEVNPCGYSGVA